MENNSVYEKFENLQKEIASQNFQYLFADKEDAAMQMMIIQQAIISYKRSKTRSAMHSRLTQDNDAIREELINQLIHLNEICDAYGVEHIFTGDTNNDSDISDFIAQFS